MSPPPSDRERAIEAGVRTFKTIGSPGHPIDEVYLRARVAAAYDRA